MWNTFNPLGHMAFIQSSILNVIMIENENFFCFEDQSLKYEQHYKYPKYSPSPTCYTQTLQICSILHITNILFKQNFVEYNPPLLFLMGTKTYKMNTISGSVV